MEGRLHSTDEQIEKARQEMRKTKLETALLAEQIAFDVLEAVKEDRRFKEIIENRKSQNTSK